IVADPGVCSILILLELCSAFDTLDHDVIINHLECSVVINDILAWFQGGISPHPYSDGLPWESVLVPLLCSIYVIYNYNNLCCFADDTPLYVALAGSKINTTSSLMTSLSDLKCLKSVNFLKASDFKSEVLLFFLKKKVLSDVSLSWRRSLLTLRAALLLAE
uniref:Reverse transcriptase domain-containing protein n=1 Tax=Neolamprologus brichardi TaxID=32507 RepID=A0A3Q4N2B3_NEOBR